MNKIIFYIAVVAAFTTFYSAHTMEEGFLEECKKLSEPTNDDEQNERDSNPIAPEDLIEQARDLIGDPTALLTDLYQDEYFVINSAQIILSLLEQGANPNIYSPDGGGLLNNAAHYNPTLVPILLSFGAELENVSERDKLEFLAQNGITVEDVNMLDDKYLTMLLRVLKEAVKQDTTCLKEALLGQHYDTADELCLHGASLSLLNNFSQLKRIDMDCAVKIAHWMLLHGCEISVEFRNIIFSRVGKLTLFVLIDEINDAQLALNDFNNEPSASQISDLTNAFLLMAARGQQTLIDETLRLANYLDRKTIKDALTLSALHGQLPTFTNLFRAIEGRLQLQPLSSQNFLKAITRSFQASVSLLYNALQQRFLSNRAPEVLMSQEEFEEALGKALAWAVLHNKEPIINFILDSGIMFFSTSLLLPALMVSARQNNVPMLRRLISLSEIYLTTEEFKNALAGAYRWGVLRINEPIINELQAYAANHGIDLSIFAEANRIGAFMRNWRFSYLDRLVPASQEKIP